MSHQDHKQVLKRKYTRIAATYHAARYDPPEGAFHYQQSNRMLRRLIQEKLPSNLRDHALDVASGTGRNLEMLSTFPFRSVWALDRVTEMMHCGKKESRTPRSAICIQGDAEKLPFRDHSFDLVVCSRFFHLIPKEMKKNCLEEFLRVANPAGLVTVECVNALYFLNPRTFLRTLYKSLTQKDYYSKKTLPLFLNFQYPLFKIQRVQGLWLPGLRHIQRYIPFLAAFFENMLSHFPFYLLSERLLIAFMPRPRIKQKDNVSLEFSRNAVYVHKKIRARNLQNFFRFQNDLAVLEYLQARPSTDFGVLRLYRKSLFSYTTVFENVVPVTNRELLSDPFSLSGKAFLRACISFKNTLVGIHNLPNDFIQILNYLDQVKRLYYLMTQKLFTFQQLGQWMKCALRSRLCRNPSWEFPFHGDFLSGGNISRDESQNRFVFMDFENLQRKAFFLNDLIHMLCKNPVINVFEDPSVCEWIHSYLGEMKFNSCSKNKKAFELQLQNAFCTALLRRVYDRARVPKGDEEGLKQAKKNLAFCLNSTQFNRWASPLLHPWFLS